MPGRVRFHLLALAASLALVGGLAPMPGGGVVRAVEPLYGLYMDSIGPDGIGPGLPTLWPTAWLSVTGYDDVGVVAYHTSATGPGGNGMYDISFTAPAGQHLVAGGTYAGGVEMSGTGYCVPEASGFTILAPDSGPDPGLAVSFWLRCYSGSPVFYGELRIDSVVPLRALLVDALAVAYPDTPTATPGETKTITVRSAGNEALTLASVAFSPATADFSITSETCTAAPVAPGSSCDINVQFAPQTGGRKTAKLVLDDDTRRGSHVVTLTGTALLPASAVTWGSTRTLPPAYSWNTGAALARTVTSGTGGYLHSVASTDRVGSRWVTDSGPYLGVMYARSGNNGGTWSTPVRINPTGQHGDQARVAGSGKYVYVAWTSEKRWVRWSGTLPRTLYVRVNANHGSGSWGTIKRLTSLTGRVGTPSIAAAGSSVYVAYTDSATGSIKLAISRDRASTWRTISLGATTASSSGGRLGVPVVAVAGTLVLVSWTADNNGAVKARSSTNSGTSWSSTVTLATSAASASAAATATGRAVVAWAGPDGARLRTWKAGTWSDTRVVAPPYTGPTYLQTWWPAVSLGGTAGVGVAFPTCWASCAKWNTSARVDLVWAESKDGGLTWYRDQLLASAASSSSRRVNYYPSVVWYGSTRYVSWVGETPTTSAYRVYLRAGAGAP